MLCDRFSDYMIDAGSSILEVRPRESGYLPKPEVAPETFDTADLFPDPNNNNSRGAWIVGVDSEVLDKRTKEIEAEEKLNPPKKPFQKKSDPEAEGEEPEADADADTENNSEDENGPAADPDAGDDDAQKAGEDILNIDEEVGDKDSGDGGKESEAPKKKSSFSDMWRKKNEPEEDAEASEEE